MRKVLTILLSIVIACGMALGLAACNPRDDEGNGDITPNTETVSRTDPRSAVYSAYKADGTKIGDYKSIANAANAAVGGGLNSYVTKIGDATKMFVNREGYEKGSNDECFWYLENGTSLDSFWCYDNVDTYASLQNGNFTTLHTQGYGGKSTQFHNSYKVVGRQGEIDSNLNANYYELSSTLDASIMAFTHRPYSGITKMTYEIDLSAVKITPAYTTGDETSQVYAFLGYYMWQDYYVVNVGIACDVNTGNWYPYIGSSRDDSASDTVYSTENLVMTSTYNEASGYFVPNASKLTLTVETLLLEDEDGVYQVNEFKAIPDRGNTYTKRIDQGEMNSFFPNTDMGMENSYIFVAGLDVISEIADKPKVQNVDYFNGAKFEMTVTKAEGYVPTEEELSDTVYGYRINPDYRGKTHNLLTANGADEIYDYTLINNSVFTTYSKGDGKDIYTFNFDKYNNYNPATANALSTVAKPYQDAINALSAVTKENAIEMADAIAAVEKWYGEDAAGSGSTLHVKYRNILDFTHFLTAKQTLSDAVALDEAATVFVKAFNEIPALSAYVMGGYKEAKTYKVTDPSTDKASDVTVKDGRLLYADYTAMKTLMADYDNLTAEMKANVFYHISQTAFEDWQTFVEEMNAAYSHESFSNEGIKAYVPGRDTKGAEMTLTPEVALGEIAFWMLRIKANDTWTDKTTVGRMNYDNSYQQSEMILVAIDYLEGLGIAVPTWFTDTVEALPGYDNLSADYEALKAIIEIGSFWQNELANPPTGIVIKTNAITTDQAALLTQYVTSGWAYKDGGVVWNMNNNLLGGGRPANTLAYHVAEGSTYTTFTQCIDNVMAVLQAHGYTPDPACRYKITEKEVVAKAAVVVSVDSLTAEGKTFYNAWIKMGSISSFNYVGWETTEADTTGYIANAAKSASSLKASYVALGDEDKTVLTQILDITAEDLAAELDKWIAFGAEIVALENNEVYNAETQYDFIKEDGSTEAKLTAKEILSEIIKQTLRIKSGGVPVSGAANYEMKGDEAWTPSVYIVNLVEKYKAIGLTLPAFLLDEAGTAGVLVDIKYDNFFDAYDSLFQTIQLAQAIKEGGITELSALSEAQLAVLNKYWVSGYTINSVLSWNWNSGNKLELYYSARVALVVKLAGGTLKNGETPLKCFEYFKIVEDFLTKNGYTAKANGWGVTAAEITVPEPEPEPEPTPEIPA